ncbi:MAG: hypothetical protein NUV45_11910 [Tepidanaerobacteraceae bacterium]|jgi:hypothetical protein|nr:hypothetical protein [Tepidanaerobacteraceae bacterium]
MVDDLQMFLASKKGIVEEIRNTTLDILKALEAKDAELVLKLLKLRKQQMDKIDEMDNNAASAFSGDRNALQKRIESDMESKNIFQSIMSLLKEVKGKDDECMIKVRKLRDEISVDLTNLKQTGRALKGYGASQSQPSGYGAFIDTKK